MCYQEKINIPETYYFSYVFLIILFFGMVTNTSGFHSNFNIFIMIIPGLILPVGGLMVVGVVTSVFWHPFGNWFHTMIKDLDGTSNNEKIIAGMLVSSYIISAILVHHGLTLW